MNQPPNAADNAAIRTWPSSQPQYENWYALVNHPTRRFSFWFRYTLLSTSTGVKEARVWAIPVNADEPDRVRIATTALPQDAFKERSAPWELEFGDAGRVRHGQFTGDVKDAQGRIAWDLTFTPASSSVIAVASPLVRRLASTSSHRSPNSAVLVSGHVDLDGERVEFHNATAHQGHTEGSRMQPKWVWGRAGGFEGEPNAFFEGVSVEKGGRKMTSFTVNAFEKRFELNRVSHLRGPLLGLLGPGNTAEWTPGQWQLKGEEQRRNIVATLNATGMQPTKVRYMDTDGAPKFLCMFALSSCALSITPAIQGSNVSTTLLSKGKANMEFSSPTPLLGTADQYLPLH